MWQEQVQQGATEVHVQPILKHTWDMFFGGFSPGPTKSGGYFLEPRCQKQEGGGNNAMGGYEDSEPHFIISAKDFLVRLQRRSTSQF